MFYYLNGTLAHLDLSFAVIDCGGVGYKLTISGTTHAALAGKAQNTGTGVANNTVRLYTHMAVREDDIELFGFATETELSSFRMLISVSGVGPKAAISILSILTPEKFALAVCTDDKKAISKASGVGAKTAARIVLELHDKLKKEGGMLSTGTEDVTVGSEADGSVSVSGGKSRLSEAIDALMVLGYSRNEAMTALRDIDTSSMSIEAIIKEALKKLMRR